MLRFECGIYHRRKVDKQSEHCTLCGGCSAPMLKRDRMIGCALDGSETEWNESAGAQASESEHDRERVRERSTQSSRAIMLRAPCEPYRFNFIQLWQFYENSINRFFSASSVYLAFKHRIWMLNPKSQTQSMVNSICGADRDGRKFINHSQQLNCNFFRFQAFNRHSISHASSSS